ncbi:MAG: hypothetical protein NVS9B1_08020 [Candidatus Dormibacteraceae bacterium]
MDDYAKEIADLHQEALRLIESEGDADEIAELELQARVLGAIYERALELYDQGARNPELPIRLRMRGYGDWDLENVYAFVYEQSVEIPDTDTRAFVREITTTDFAGVLAAS